MKNTVGAFDWFLFRVLHAGPRKFKPSTRTSGIGAFRESHGAMLPAGPAVVVDYRTHLLVIQSNAPKLIKLHPPFIYFSQASAFRRTRPLGRPTKIFLEYNKYGTKIALRRKNKAAVNLKTGRFDNINSAVIISSVCKAVQNCKN